jgi:hypothetical protein
MWASRWFGGVGVVAACLGAVIGCGGETTSGRGAADDAAGSGGSGDTSTAGGGDFGNPTTPARPTPTTPINPGGTGCAPGHYVGSFEGIYNSAAWGNGSAPLMVTAVESNDGKPGLEFWLEASEAPCPADSEFCGDFTVKGGKIRGFADPFTDPNAAPGAANPFAIKVPFEIDFGGDLDCSTGQFNGLLQNGCYDVATVLYRFEGTAPATYDKPTTTFTMGEWTVKEIPNAGVLFPPDANIGGSGEWTATLMDDGSSPVAAGMGLCDTATP